MTPIIWLMGLSGSGKTTLGSLLRLYLDGQGIDAEFIDADNFCRSRCLSTETPQQRVRNTDTLRDYALGLQAGGKTCVVAAATPYEGMRQANRALLPNYREVWVRCSLQTLVQRDTKGLYAKAERGDLQALDSVFDAFDEPRCPHAIIETDVYSLVECYEQLRDLALHSLMTERDWHEEASRMLPQTARGIFSNAAIAL
ncbi:adenylyl-sulfate kinase [Desulfovibrio desulfuricans]|uniref:Adenylyl-sulfate kinase n=1 Tax=Desulfovibrio desulfuricans TaxID=876 RepID=A0A4P7UP27_DESDE|nr:adenylyl-sulfate kinase [Desulfovibrio desulfuricans]QCC86838.1 adenylyl-sulfate kinase [Desulfovibrio desulfuricans]